MEMTASTLLGRLRKRGVRFTVDGKTLRAEAPRGVLTPDLREEVGRHRLELLRLIALEQEAQQLALDAGSVRGYLCGGCWRRLSEAALRVVQEGVGCGFRCVDCLMNHGGSPQGDCNLV